MSTSDSSEPARQPAEAVTRPQDKSPARGMVAGTLLLSGVLLGALAGGLIGVLVGAFGPLLAVGLFLGFAGGTAAVIVRFRDL
jgi:F0F1-type ATP synthase assembly protein I